MTGIFSKKFHRQTDFNFTLGTPPSDPQYWPEEWKEIQHKSYPRFPRMELSENFLDLGSLEKSLENRHSQREFDRLKKISFEELSTILHYSAGINPENKQKEEAVCRFYPSGGARYPLEIYLAIQRVERMIPGIYHFNVKDNALETLTLEPEYMEDILEGLFQSWSKQAAVIIFTTAVWDRTFIKYKDRGYRIILLEAGHLNHNFALTASALGIGCCNSLGFHNQRINEVLDIENANEDSVYMTLLGR
ncbi:MAG: SagB family peptide dehydrogenase [Parcubacteria group bacterium]